jgi:hypothetical protein
MGSNVDEKSLLVNMAQFVFRTEAGTIREQICEALVELCANGGQ